MSTSRVTGSAAASRSSQSSSQRRQRSRSTSRYADLDKPKKKRPLSGTTSLVSLPNTLKLSMLNSGLLSFDRIKLEARDEHNSLSATIPDKPIDLKIFVKLCEQRRKFPVLYKLEFQTAVKVETNTCKHAHRKNNLEKNQNQKCIPYDYNRVVLEKIDGITDSDYVNASYVDSLLKPNAYIVTQGPTEDTVCEFWRLIWQENVSAIIMLTKTFDFTKVMCVQYWPASKEKDESYGDLWIGIAKEEQLANFQIRTFHLYKKGLNGEINEERNILQFHYTEWHSHTCPFNNAVLEFRRRVRSVVGNIIKTNSMVGPMLVHCNDGGGRSGVYLAIDANMELAEEEDCYHVFGYLKKLRQSRKGLIENVDQYKFVYDTLEEHIVCGKSWFPVSQLSEKLKQKSQKDHTKMNEYQREYAQICKQTPRFSIGDCAGGHRADNREKNRDVLCVPPDNFRPYLTSFQGNAFTDYINAVFVDGYTKPREYIVTEWPLHKTLGEFWSLVYDHECSAVVVICNPPPASQLYPAFWPEKRKSSQKFGPVFTVTCKTSKHYTNIKTWEFSINKKIVSLTELMAGVKAPTRTVQLFQLTCWPMGHKVPTSTNSLVELMNMVEQWRDKAEYGPVCVVSPDGRSRAGVYCAANACIEQVIQHGEVDIFQAVKTVRRHRPQLVENITEYKYCYDLVLHYVLHYLNKDLKEKKFIEFGRGKVIPLTPENSKADLPSEISNIGRIVVNKCIEKIEKVDTSASLLFGPAENLSQLNSAYNSQVIIQRKKKKRLYSLGGNEPIRMHRGRLDRLKTVGTFDLSIEEMPKLDENMQAQSSSTNNSTSTELFTSTNNSLSSSCNSPKDLATLRRKKGSKLVRQVECIENSHENSSTTLNASNSVRNSSTDVKRQSTDTDDDVITVINDDTNLTDRPITGRRTTALSGSSEEKVRSPDEVFVKAPSQILANSKDFKTRKSTFTKSKRITRTDSELIQENLFVEQQRRVSTPRCVSEDIELQELKTTTSGGAQKPVLEKFPTDSFVLDKEHRNNGDGNEEEEEAEGAEDEDQFNVVKNLQREYKSDGNSLDEVGLPKVKTSKWINQSLDNCLLSSETELGSLNPDDNPTRKEFSPEKSSTSKLFDNPFGKFKKINKVWKCKRFSSTNVYDKKKQQHLQEVISPTSQTSSTKQSKESLDKNIASPTSKEETQTKSQLLVSNSSTSNNGSSFLFKIRQQSTLMGLTANSSPSPSVTSSHSQPRKLFPKLTSLSNTDLYKNNKSKKTGKISKSNTEINNTGGGGGSSGSGFLISPFRRNANKQKQSTKTSIKLNKLKTSSAGCLYQSRKRTPTRDETTNPEQATSTKVNSPLSEEFYNKTGSVRLSAIELFEKFCSDDFGGLYKHELDEPEEEFRKPCRLFEQKALPYVISSASGTLKKTMFRKNSKLLKQRSEPKFSIKLHNQFRFDDGSILNEEVGSPYYDEEDGSFSSNMLAKEPVLFGDPQQLYYEGDDYEEVDDCYEEEEAYEDQVGTENDDDVDDDDENNQYIDENVDDIEEQEYENYFRSRELQRLAQYDEEEDQYDDNLFVFENNKIFLNDNQEVDEIYLMPDESGLDCSDFQKITSTMPTAGGVGGIVGGGKGLSLQRAGGVDCGLNELNNSSNDNTLLFSVIKDYVQNSRGDLLEDNADNNEDKCFNQDNDILTIYRICSEENLLSPKINIPTSKSETQFVLNRKLQKSNQLIFDNMNILMRSKKKKQAVRDDSYNSLRSGKEPLSNCDEKDECERGEDDEDDDKGSTTGDTEDTVRFLCPDSIGSKLSLSLKSELFDDLSLNFSLTLTENKPNKKLLAPDCDVEDFNLTSEGSITDSLDMNLKSNEPVDEGEIPKIDQDDSTDNFPEVIKKDTIKEEVESKIAEAVSEEKGDLEKDSLIESETLIESFLSENSKKYSKPSFSFDENSDSEDVQNEEDMNKVSNFTNELQKEFDILFDQAATIQILEQSKVDNEAAVVAVTSELVSTPGSLKLHKSSSQYHNHQNLISNVRTKISSRHSMQNLEPYEPQQQSISAQKHPETNDEIIELRTAVACKSVDQLIGGSAGNNSKASVKQQSGSKKYLDKLRGGGGGDGEKSKQKRHLSAVNDNENGGVKIGCVHNLCLRFRKRKSLSLGNLNRKSNCFPL